jgi:hypothetical protein
MTDKSKPKTGQSKPKVGKLELNKESAQELTESEAEAAQGGMLPRTLKPGLCKCTAGNSGCAP